MTHKRITPLLLFKVLFLILVYISTTIGWCFFVAPSLISNASTLEVLTGFFGTACWLIVSACLFSQLLSNEANQPILRRILSEEIYR